METMAGIFTWCELAELERCLPEFFPHMVLLEPAKKRFLRDWEGERGVETLTS